MKNYIPEMDNGCAECRGDAMQFRSLITPRYA